MTEKRIVRGLWTFLYSWGRRKEERCVSKKINLSFFPWHYSNLHRLVMTQWLRAALHAFWPLISVTLGSSLGSVFSVDKLLHFHIYLKSSWAKTLKVKRENKLFICRWKPVSDGRLENKVKVISIMEAFKFEVSNWFDWQNWDWWYNRCRVWLQYKP